MNGQHSDRQGTTIIRNGHKLCARCARRGCLRVLGGPDVEQPHVSDEACECCGPDFEVNDGFDI